MDQFQNQNALIPIAKQINQQVDGASNKKRNLFCHGEHSRTIQNKFRTLLPPFTSIKHLHIP